MDYSWLEIIKNCLDSIDINASKLLAASTGKTIGDSELRMTIAEIEDNTSRVSRLLSLEKNREVFSKYQITSRELYLLTPDIDDDTRRSLLRGDRGVFKKVAERLKQASLLWKERIIEPANSEPSGLEETQKHRFQRPEQNLESKAIVLLGAGASRPLGIPTMADFWPIVQANCQYGDENLALGQLLKAAQDEITQLPPDLERLLIMLDRYETYYRILWEDRHFGLSSSRFAFFRPYIGLFPWSRERPLEQSLRRCGQFSIGISGIRDKVVAIMDAIYTKSLNKENVTALYNPLFSLLYDSIKENNITIFTTNYDTAIEQYCRYSGLRLIDGFQKTGPNLVWNPVGYYQKPDPIEKTITLFKLHGSLTWRKIGNEIIEFGMSARSMPGDMALIYPTETKEYPYEEPFKTAYKSLDRFLKTAEVAIVIGYSFRDRGIAYIIDEAQSINPNLKFIVVCGEKPEEDTRKRFPYESHPIENDFKPGNNSEYLTRLDALINESQKAN